MKNLFILVFSFWIMLLVSLSIAGYILWENGLYFCTVFCVFVLILVAIHIYRLQTKAFVIMRNVINCIHFSDFTFTCSSTKRSRLLSEFTDEITTAMAKFRQRLYEEELKHQYYETLLDTVDAGILVIDEQGNVEWMNNAVNHLLRYKRLKHIDELTLLNSEFSAVIRSLVPGEVKMLRIQNGDFFSELALTSTLFISKGKERILLSLKNIRSVLEENELQAWQKLIRVLTHEIMNSIAPIISLSETMGERNLQNETKERDYAVMQQAMQTIHRRSKGLLNFVENYRKLTRVPAPVLTFVPVNELFADLKKLYACDYVVYEYIDNPQLCIFIDRSQIEQVLINLLKNAYEACEMRENPHIKISAKWIESSNVVYINITDNGVGILPDVVDKIFVPFFTTKLSGSGIGLSLCKQIMNLHNGGISVTSEVDKGSCFTLKFVGK